MPAASPRARRTGRQRLYLAVGAITSFSMLLAASALGYLYFRVSQIDRVDVTIDRAGSGEPRNYLIVGSDSRANLDPDDPENFRFFDDTISTSGLRTDTIMVLRIDPETTNAHLLSLPRDLWVEISGTGSRNRINSAFAKGRDVLIATIRENFGIPIHHYVEVDFVGFQSIVSAIGGVDFYFPEPVQDRNSGLYIPTPGCITLEAEQALAFARSRHLEIQDVDTGRWRTDPTGDLGRISRQQELIRRAVGKAVRKGFTSPATLQGLLNTAADDLTLDPTLEIRDLLSLGGRFANFNDENLSTYSLPVTDFRTAAGAAVLDLVDAKAEPIFNIFRGLDPAEVSPPNIEVQVLNGTGIQGQGADVTAALTLIGFATVDPANTVERFARTAVFYAPGSEKAAERLARHVQVPVAFGIDESLGSNEVVLVTGDDFTTLHDQPSPTIPVVTTTTTTAAQSDSSTTTIQVIDEVTSTTSTTAPVGYVPGDEAVDCG